MALLWLWQRPLASALIGPLAWEFPYATSEVLKRQRNKEREKERKREREREKGRKERKKLRSSRCGSVVTSLTGIHKDIDSIPGLAQWVKDPALP